MVTFHFDPSCPWTWLTSRWLVGEADRRGEGVTWRAFPLAFSGEEPTPPSELAPRQAMAVAFLRVLERLRADDRNDDIGALYSSVGEAIHEGDTAPHPAVVTEACRALDLGDAADAATDEQWDGALLASLAEARALVGDDVGSPVLVYDHGRAFFGPIFSARPGAQDAAQIWDATKALAAIPEVAELKRGRGIGVEFDPVLQQ